MGFTISYCLKVTKIRRIFYVTNKMWFLFFCLTATAETTRKTTKKQRKQNKSREKKQNGFCQYHFHIELDELGRCSLRKFSYATFALISPS